MIMCASTYMGSNRGYMRICKGIISEFSKEAQGNAFVRPQNRMIENKGVGSLNSAFQNIKALPYGS